jgi:hypothetical protein
VVEKRKKNNCVFKKHTSDCNLQSFACGAYFISGEMRVPKVLLAQRLSCVRLARKLICRRALSKCLAEYVGAAAAAFGDRARKWLLLFGAERRF